MTSWDHHHQLIGRIRYRFRRTVASRQPHGNHYNHPCRNWDVIYQHYQSGTCTVRMRPRGQSLIWARSIAEGSAIVFACRCTTDGLRFRPRKAADQMGCTNAVAVGELHSKDMTTYMKRQHTTRFYQVKNNYTYMSAEAGHRTLHLLMNLYPLL
uniref:(northern house mosquito) hypothetical protein n=1 Tax=Culex pipiens TaxID=7175 RepID=A0A8D8AJA7_CULPI